MERGREGGREGVMIGGGKGERRKKKMIHNFHIHQI